MNVRPSARDRGHRELRVIKPTVLFVALGSGIGGSLRSMATVLEHLDGTVRRVVAAESDTTFARLLADRSLADAVVGLPSAEHRGRLSRIPMSVRVARAAWSVRGSLTAIHANGLPELNLVAPAAAALRVPVVAWCHEWSVSPWAARLAPLWRFALPTLRFATVSRWSANLLAEARIASNRELAVVPDPVDPADVDGKPTGGGPVVRVGYLGSPAPYKGFHFLPEIIRRTGDATIRWLLFAGPQTEMPAVWADLRSIGGDVRFAGKMPDVRQAYRQCDIVLCPSVEESFGRTAAEAMANGLPVVASDIEPLRAVLGEAGTFFPVGAVDAAAAAVRRLAQDPPLRQALGRAGRERARRFAPAPVVAALKKLYGLSPSREPS
jgi:glycosyltransferase involved in cell wall biosynthesis